MNSRNDPEPAARWTLFSRLKNILMLLDPAVVFLFASVVGGVGFLVVTPPFQVPDEPAHFYRAYSLSQGNFNPQVEGGKPGAVLPASLRHVVRIMVDDVPFHPERRVQRKAWRAARVVELEPEVTELVRFPKSLQYSALPYVPQAAGIAFGGLFGASPLTLMFCARLANLIVATVLIFLCVRQLPAYRWLALLFALNPMAMTLRSSVSADALTTAVAFLLTAKVTRIAFATSRVLGARDIAVVLGLSVALCLTKPVYLPLALMILVISPRRVGVYGRWGVAAAILALSMGAAILGVFVALPSAGSVKYQIGPRLVEVVLKPWQVSSSAAVDYIVNAPRYGAQFIGELGWLDTPLPPALILTYAVFLTAYVVIDSDPSIQLERWQRIVLGFAVVGSLFAISAAVFVMVGRVEGLQGRYFHPIALAAAWFIYVGRWGLQGEKGWVRPAGVLVLTTVSFVVSWWILFQRYYGV